MRVGFSESRVESGQGLQPLIIVKPREVQDIRCDAIDDRLRVRNARVVALQDVAQQKARAIAPELDIECRYAECVGRDRSGQPNR